MGETVNRTWEAAAHWQAQVVWIRMNVAYLRAEIPYVSGNGENVADLEQLARDFEPAYAIFCEEEMAVFTAARRVEDELISRDDFIAKVRALGSAFQPWLAKVHAAVEARRAAGSDGLGTNLLLGCGAELHNAQRRLATEIEQYATDSVSA